MVETDVALEISGTAKTGTAIVEVDRDDEEVVEGDVFPDLASGRVVTAAVDERVCTGLLMVEVDAAPATSGAAGAATTLVGVDEDAAAPEVVLAAGSAVTGVSAIEGAAVSTGLLVVEVDVTPATSGTAEEGTPIVEVDEGDTADVVEVSTLTDFSGVGGLTFVWAVVMGAGSMRAASDTLIFSFVEVC